MTEMLFRQNAYLKEAEGVVREITPEGGIVVDRTVFYPTGGGQPGDRGRLDWDGGALEIATARKAEGDGIALIPAEGAGAPPQLGTTVAQTLDWDCRFERMRVHTALHLLSVVIPLPVTGGAIGDGRGRLDFDMPDAPENPAGLEAALAELIDRDLPVTEEWITDDELKANPQLVKTMSVSPPTGAGKVRLVRIGTAEDQVDLQPCGGTHVDRTIEIGAVRFGKIEKKGRRNRRVYLHLA